MDEVLLVTARSLLVEEVGRLAERAGAPLRVVPDAGAAGPAWRTAPAVLLGDDAAALGVPVRRPGVLLVAGAPAGGERLWRAAVAAGAEAVAVLPEQAGQVHDALLAAGEGARTARVVAVVGACGGAGASVLAAAVAAVAADGGSGGSGGSGARAVLVDGDPLGGGLDLLVGAEGEPGLRWGDLAGARGTVRSAAVVAALPRGGPGARVPVVSWSSAPGEGAAPSTGPRAAPAAAVEAVLDAAARASDVVVVDAGRRADAVADAVLWRADLVVLLAPASLRAVAAAQALAPALRERAADARLVVATGPAEPLAVADVVDAVGLPLLARAPREREVRALLARGEPLLAPRGHLARCARAVLDAVLEPAGAPGPGGAG